MGGGTFSTASYTTHVLPTSGGEIDLAGAIGSNSYTDSPDPNDFKVDNTGGIWG